MVSAVFSRALIIVRGGGDLASGAIYRLVRAGFPVMVTELENPLLVRRTVSYGEAVYSGQIMVEGLTAVLAANVERAVKLLAQDVIPVLVDPAGRAIQIIQPTIVVDARMEKRRLDTHINLASLVVALGPGCAAGADCHAVVETNRGHNLGRVIWSGSAEADTGIPGDVQNVTHSRVLRAPAGGHVIARSQIGDKLAAGQIIAEVAGVSVAAPFEGVLRGLIHEHVRVSAGMKIGDLDPRIKRENCFTISDKALAVGGGVLEAVLAAPQIRPYLQMSGHETPAGI